MCDAAEAASSDDPVAGTCKELRARLGPYFELLLLPLVGEIRHNRVMAAPNSAPASSSEVETSYWYSFAAGTLLLPEL